MANTKSALKAQRQADRRTARNKPIRSAIRTKVKKAVVAVATANEQAPAILREAVRALDKAAEKGIIHKNNSARRKSRLMSRLHAQAGAPAVEVKVAKTKAVAATPSKVTATKAPKVAVAKAPVAKAATTGAKAAKASAEKKPAAPKKGTEKA